MPGYGLFTVVIGEATCGRCLEYGTNAEGGACAEVNGCAEGLACVLGCRKPCTSSAVCGAGQQCAGADAGEPARFCGPVPSYGLCTSTGRLQLSRFDPASGLCVVVELEASATGSGAVTVPAGWGGAVARAGYPDAGCPLGLADAGTAALSLNGAIGFDAGSSGSTPSSATLRLTLTFAPDSGLPSTLPLGSSDVRGCP